MIGIGPLLALGVGVVVAVAGLLDPVVAVGGGVVAAALVAAGQRRGSAWVVVAGGGLAAVLAAGGVLSERDTSPLVAGLLGVLAFGAIEAGSWAIERRGITDLDGSPAGPRAVAVASVAGAALVLAALLAEAPAADPSPVSVVVGATAVSTLFLGAGWLLRR